MKNNVTKKPGASTSKLVHQIGKPSASSATSMTQLQGSLGKSDKTSLGASSATKASDQSKTQKAAALGSSQGPGNQSERASSMAILKIEESHSETKKRQKMVIEGKAMRDPEDVSAMLITRVFEVDVEKKYIIVGKDNGPRQSLDDRCAIPAEQKICELFLDRLNASNTEITVVPRGRDAKGKRRFECYPRHLNPMAHRVGDQNVVGLNNVETKADKGGKT